MKTDQQWVEESPSFYRFAEREFFESFVRKIQADALWWAANQAVECRSYIAVTFIEMLEDKANELDLRKP